MPLYLKFRKNQSSVMQRLLLAIVSMLLLLTPARADEGMWLPIYLKMLNGDMSRMGARLTADDIYNINQASVKDAIVQMGNFCTGEIVSNRGMVFTNHHCGYDAIATLSSTATNYLDNGYWASNQAEEIPVPDLTMQILVRMEDVTSLIDNGSVKTADSLVDAASQDGRYSAEIVDMYYGTEHYLMVYEVFRDIRFVGAPPSSIGKFGGDTDNWMWPRHTGDFSIFRIYANRNNEPADYSEDNIPYNPKHFLKVSLNGYQPGDFTFIMGYPGSTERYLTAAGATKTVKEDYPLFVRLLGTRLQVMKTHMDRDDEVRLALAGEYASLANSHKYFKGVVERSRNSSFIQDKEEFEAQFTGWVEEDDNRWDTYGEVVADLADLYERNRENSQLMTFIGFAGFAPGLVNYGLNYFGMLRRADNDQELQANTEALDELRAATAEHFASYNTALDRDMMAAMMRLLYKGLQGDNQPAIFQSPEFLKFRDKEGADRFDQFTDFIMKKSILADPAKAEKWIAKPRIAKIKNDIGYRFMNSLLDIYIGKMMSVQMASSSEENAMGKFVSGMRAMQTDRNFYPDANSTLRFTYGSVKNYPADNGTYYSYYTTADEMLAKYVPGDEEFDMPASLRELLTTRDYGRYGNEKDLWVNFITNNDITGGNSGSPVMDADGDLIGIAFDGNWESMLSDLYFDETVTRTICVDIRYVLFVIDKMANAQYIMRELVIADKSTQVEEQGDFEGDKKDPGPPQAVPVEIRR